MNVLVIFLDGVGLGERDPSINPLCEAHLPTLQRLLDGEKLVRDAAPFVGKEATLLGLDANLGVDGTPQSASGQATLLTGTNVPALIGAHYGPKPNRAIRKVLIEDNLFMQVLLHGGTAALLNAYPPRYFEAIDSGLRLYSAIPFALQASGLPLMTAEDLQAGRALSVDFTGQGWADQPDFPPAPVYELEQAGDLLADLATQYDLSWFDFWPSDYAGHKQDHVRAVEILESLDTVLKGLVQAWHGKQRLIVLTSDHGNLEDLSQRMHTRNPVPALLIGPSSVRARFARDLQDLADLSPAVMDALFGDPD